MEAADVALFTNDLRCLAPVMQLGRMARRKILQNVTLSVVTKVAISRPSVLVLPARSPANSPLNSVPFHPLLSGGADVQAESMPSGTGSYFHCSCNCSCN
jgi:cation transport ATPase